MEHLYISIALIAFVAGLIVQGIICAWQTDAASNWNKRMRYAVEDADGYGYYVIDTTIEDGEPCNVDGAVTRVEAERICTKLNGLA